MEKVDKIKGSGNSYDFGARFYDARIARFLSIDPLSSKFPNESPYMFAGNTPITAVDEEGKFKIYIHLRILYNAFKNKIQLNNNEKINRQILRSMQQGISKDADISGAFSDYHFDGRKGFTAVNQTWVNVNTNVNKQIEFLGKMAKGWGDKMPGMHYRHFGIMLHTIQDFYSHSNYVELYLEYYKSQNNGTLPTSVPLYKDGILIKGFRALMERTTYDENGKYQGLYTGEFHLLDNEFWDLIWGRDAHTGPNSHKHTNKDKAKGLEGKLAEDAAMRDTEERLKELEINVNE